MSPVFHQSAPPKADDPFVRQVRGALSRLLTERLDGMTVLVALSGGPDSCALLAALKAIASEERLNLRACHVNHGLRGAESDADEQFCRELCAHWQIPLYVERLPGARADEATLRQARYAVLSACALKESASCVLTAHNADDQVETVLFRLFRGSAPMGMAGIPEKRRLNAEVSLVRPLLDASRGEVLALLERIALVACEDSSNRSTVYGRNHIRHLVLPAILAKFPAASLNIQHLQIVMRDEQDFLSELTQRALSQVQHDEDAWGLAEFVLQPLSIRRRLITDALRLRDVEVSFERVSAVLNVAMHGGGALSLDEFWDVRAAGGVLSFEYKTDNVAENAPAIEPTTLLVPGVTVAPALGASLQIEIVNDVPPQGFPPAAAHEAVVDLSRVVPPLVVRRRLPGDLIQPLGMASKVKLKKYLHTHQSKNVQNRLAAVVVADAEEIVWVPGVGLSEKIKVVAKPSHCLRFMRTGNGSAAAREW